MPNLYDSNRILTIKEMKVGDVVHSGFTGGFCSKWTVIFKTDHKVFLQHKNGTTAYTDGIQLRRWATYFPKDCPLCDLQETIQKETPEIQFLRQNLGPSNVGSTFRFRAAQLTRRRHSHK